MHKQHLLRFSMQFDDTGTFQVIPVPPVGNYEPLERLRRCTLCYGKTSAKVDCAGGLMPSQRVIGLGFCGRFLFRIVGSIFNF